MVAQAMRHGRLDALSYPRQFAPPQRNPACLVPLHPMNLTNTASSPPFIIAHDPRRPVPRLEHCVVAIGNFDGVHRGHAVVIEHATRLARQLARPSAVLTFEPHPADFFAASTRLFRLTPEIVKGRALAGLGLAGMIVLQFDAQLAGLSAEAFVSDVLVRRLGIAAAVVGYDFHFGKARQGSPAFLLDAGRRHGFAVEVVEKVTADASGSLVAVSSTAIREALESGAVATAAGFLGRPWSVIGTVIAGEKLGRTLGFPTANLRLDPACRLAHGIYAVRVIVDGAVFDGVASFGRRPTFDNGPPLLEVFLFDFKGDLYGKTITVSFIDWIRGEEKFGHPDDLVAQMHRDAAMAQRILAN
jgi:riboflavin kinase/FMN adenylyltransferase